MNLQNGYKVIYEKAASGKRSFYASKTGVFSDAELFTELNIGEFKLIYEKQGNFYGSITGTPAEDDYCFEDFKKVFVEDGANTDIEVEVPDEGSPEEVISEEEITPETPEASEEPEKSDDLENNGVESEDKEE